MAGETVTPDDIAEVISRWTGIPVSRLSQTERERLLKLDNRLRERVIGQESAIKEVVDSIMRSKAGLSRSNQPTGSFLFCGSTGVGKTELAKALFSELYDGDERHLVRIDMSEYTEQHSVARLIGAPPGYIGPDEGGQLTEAVRRRPFTVVLFDEIEKAHPDVFNMMLQILEDGRLTDSKGRTVDFKNVLLILTSNIGSSVIEKGGQTMGFQVPSDNEEERSYQRIRSLVLEELRSYFKPEFLNRLDEIIVFRQLTKGEVKQIADIMLKDVFKRTEAKGIALDVTERFKDRLVDEGFNPSYGARPLRRAIMRLVEDALAEKMLNGDIKEGDSIILDVDENNDIT